VVEISGLKWSDPAPFGSNKVTLAEALLTPTRIFVSGLLPLIKSGRVKGLAHITGGGLTENTPRMLPDHLTPSYNYDAWQRPEVFNWLQSTGGIAEAEMQRAFNCGLGIVLACDKNDADSIVSDLTAAGETAMIMGELKNK